MRTTYGVVWLLDGHPLARGKLELLPTAMWLDGLSAGEHVTLEIPYDDLAVVRVGRSSADRLDGHPTLVLGLEDGRSVVIASVARTGVVAELAEHLAAECLVRG
jgi:hypothetical protein